MDAGAIIYGLLAADPLVASLVADRIYPEQAPESASLPVVIYSARVGDPSEGNAPIWRLALDVHCYAATDNAAGDLAVACNLVLADRGGQHGATALRPLWLEDWQDARDTELNLWGRLLTYGGQLIQG
jgi:hypothetical protein